jgi:hypothetical protein
MAPRSLTAPTRRLATLATHGDQRTSSLPIPSRNATAAVTLLSCLISKKTGEDRGPLRWILTGPRYEIAADHEIREHAARENATETVPKLGLEVTGVPLCPFRIDTIGLLVGLVMFVSSLHQHRLDLFVSHLTLQWLLERILPQRLTA